MAVTVGPPPTGPDGGIAAFSSVLLEGGSEVCGAGSGLPLYEGAAWHQVRM